MPNDDLCCWCIQVKPVYISNGRSANLCSGCCGELQRRLPAINRAKELGERRARPMPRPFEQPKMEEFRHDQENS